MEILLVGILINTFLFGYMGFTRNKVFLNPVLNIVDSVLTFGYPASFIIILLAPGGLIRNIIIALLMQFLVNHMLWGITTGIIEGLSIRKKNEEIMKEIEKGNVAKKDAEEEQDEITRMAGEIFGSKSENK